ncbi:MAG: Integrin-like protein, partial [Candidatus Angelobacter sp.]|nr:Integrin-like protein [Candidatus Angelobacter sp.]
LNTGSGSFFLKSQVPGARGFGHRLHAGDLNGDGIEDLLIEGASIKDTFLLYALGRGDGTFTTPVLISSDGPITGLTIRDLNLDSRHDIAYTVHDAPGGFAATEVKLNQNAATNCAPPGSGTLAVNICSAATAVNSLTVKASGNSPNGVKRVELWIDGSKRVQAFSDQLNAKVGVAAGKHNVTVVGIDLYDAIVKKTISVSVP